MTAANTTSARTAFACVVLMSVLLLAVGCTSSSPTDGASSSSNTATDDTSALTSTTMANTTTTDSSTTTTAAPPPTTAPVAAVGTALAPLAAGSLTGRVIVIDPGHDGGNAAHSTDIAQQVFIGTGWKECDTSGTASYDGHPEHAHNWDVALRLAAELRAAGATVVLTRPDDTGWGPCITERARIGNDAHADVAISIHADGGPDGGRGFHVLFPAPVTSQSAAIADASQRLAVAVRDTFGTATGMPTSTYLGNAGLMARGDLGGLNLSTVPKVFVEAGNMRNGVDAALLVDPGFRQLEAQGIAAGIARYLAGG